MANHGTRKLGMITGILMLLLLFIGAIENFDTYILQLPTSGTTSLRFYVWGYFNGANYINMFTLQWPECLITWFTTVFFMASAGMTIAASTRGSIPTNSKRMFAISSVFLIIHMSVYLLILFLSSYATVFYLFLGPGFWALVIFTVLNFISLAKVQ